MRKRVSTAGTGHPDQIRLLCAGLDDMRSHRMGRMAANT
jgi:hypothetical protein